MEKDPTHHSLCFVMVTHLCSWSCMYCFSRTLINATEANLFIISLYVFVRDMGVSGEMNGNPLARLNFRKVSNLLVFMVSFTICIRPTAVVLWVRLMTYSTPFGRLIVAIGACGCSIYVFMDSWGT